jgi:hypothetical protein
MHGPHQCISPDRSTSQAIPSSVRLLAEVMATRLLVGFAMLFAVVTTLNRYPQRGRTQYLAIAAAIVASSAISVLVKDAWELAGPFGVIYATAHPGLARQFLSDWLRYAVPGALVASAYLYLRTEAENAAMAHQCAVESAQMARQVAEARLRVLEAQIEPHFLFNTLATVKRLFQTNAVAGDRMLDNLMRYLGCLAADARPSRRSAVDPSPPPVPDPRDCMAVGVVPDGHSAFAARGATAAIHAPDIDRERDQARDSIHFPKAERSTSPRERATASSSEVRDRTGIRAGLGRGTGLANIRARLGCCTARRVADLSHNKPRGHRGNACRAAEHSPNAPPNECSERPR